MMSEAAAPRTTAYNGGSARNLVRESGLFISGTPRSGRVDDSRKIENAEAQHREKWFDHIIRRTQKEKKYADPCAEECLLYVTFRLIDRGQDDRYGTRDLDNLLKLFMDGLKQSKLVVDDSLFCGIRTKKEPATSRNDEGVIFRCITTKTMMIKNVEEIPGKHLIPYWVSPMQYITAEDSDGNEGTFIDYMPGVILRDEYEKKKYYRDNLPGYEWTPGRTERGCIVQVKKHHISKAAHVRSEKQGTDKREIAFHWLQKWS